MKTTNIPAGSQRNSNVGLVWQEKITNSGGTFQVNFQQTIRVSSVDGGTIVKIDGVLAATLQKGEVEYFNAGTGQKDDNKSTVTIEISGGNAHVQLAKDIETGRRTR